MCVLSLLFQIKYHLHSQQEIQNLTTEEGIDLAGKDPDSFTKDMINVSHVHFWHSCEVST
jgi:catalase